MTEWAKEKEERREEDYEARIRERRMQGFGDAIIHAVLMTRDELLDIMERVMLFINQHGGSRFAHTRGEPIRDCAGIKIYSHDEKDYIYYFYPHFFKSEFGISLDSLRYKIDLIKPFVQENAIICTIEFLPDSVRQVVAVKYADNVEYCFGVDVVLMDRYLSKYFHCELSTSFLREDD